MPLFAAGQTPPIHLRENWRIQTLAKVNASGEAISRLAFRAEGWYAASIPSTVLAALVANHVYPDPYFGMNLRDIPGTSYPVGKIFSNLEMPEDSPFAVSWWYRTEFELPAPLAGKTIWLDFNGINYRANIWMNGQKVANADEVAGAYRRYEFDVTPYAKAGKNNALAVEVFAPRQHDLAINWVDWNPAPPDKDMGLWQDVIVRASGNVALRHPQVVTQFDLPSLGVAHLTVTAELYNAASHGVRAVVRGAFSGATFSQAVKLEPNEKKTVSFAPKDFSQLNIKQPKVWWPAELGKPELHDLTLEVDTGGRVSDQQKTKFGIAQITSELTQEGYRLFRVNGKPILIRGGGWAPDMMLRGSRDRLENELRFTKELGLNTIRLEGKLESDEFFELADREGILVMAGWCCCDHWEKWGDWKPEDRTIAAASLADQAMRLRGHPSLLVWLNGSDIPPPADVEQIYLEVLKKSGWPKPVLSSATARKTSVSGESGVKMSGPYDYVPPDYWLGDTKRGGAFGFNTETGPGPAVPPMESLRAMIPAEHLWTAEGPSDEVWKYHAGSGRFAQLDIFNAALEARYGKPKNLGDYVWKSQAMAYEGERAMFEAYRRNQGKATGVIQWMLNNAWPSLIWHLYDYFLRTGGGYYGTKKANEPLHVQYSYDDHSIVIVNSEQQQFSGLKLTAKVFNLDLSEKFSQESPVTVPASGVTRSIALPEIEDLSDTYFLKLSLRNGEGKLVSSNFYWLSTRPDTLDWEKGNSFYTPQSSFADFTGMANMPQATLDVKFSLRRGPKVPVGSAERPEGIADVTVSNPSKNLALFVRARLLRGKQEDEVLPVFWSEGYFELMPGETKEIHGSYYLKDLRGAVPAISVDAWNAAAVSQAIRSANNKFLAACKSQKNPTLTHPKRRPHLLKIRARVSLVGLNRFGGARIDRRRDALRISRFR